MGTNRGGKPGVLWAGRPKVLWWPLVPHVVGLVTRHPNGMVPTVWLGWYLRTVDASLGSALATLCDNGSGKYEAPVVLFLGVGLASFITGLPAETARVPWDGPQVRIIEHQAHARAVRRF